MGFSLYPLVGLYCRGFIESLSYCLVSNRNTVDCQRKSNHFSRTVITKLHLRSFEFHPFLINIKYLIFNPTIQLIIIIIII